MTKNAFTVPSLLLSALVDGYSNFSEEDIEKEKEKLTAEKRLTEMKLSALETVKSTRTNVENLSDNI